MAEYKAKNLRKPKNVGQGIAEYALIALKEYFKPNGIKSPEAPFAKLGDEITIKKQHEFEPNKGFIYFQLAPQKNSLKANTVGDVGLRKVNQEVAIFVPGSYEEVHATMAALLNQPLIVLVKDSNCDADFHYQLGCDCTFAYIGWELNTGTTVDGVKGYAVTLTYDGGVQIFKASGTIPMLADVATNGPTIISQPVSADLSAGDTLALVVGATGAGVISYQWKKGGVVIAGATSNTYIKANVDATDAATYTVDLTDSSGTVTSNGAVVTVQ